LFGEVVVVRNEVWKKSILIRPHTNDEDQGARSFYMGPPNCLAIAGDGYYTRSKTDLRLVQKESVSLGGFLHGLAHAFELVYQPSQRSVPA
jgi:hypothetical protein